MAFGPTAFDILSPFKDSEITLPWKCPQVTPPNECIVFLKELVNKAVSERLQWRGLLLVLSQSVSAALGGFLKGQPLPNLLGGLCLWCHSGLWAIFNLFEPIFPLSFM